MSRDLSLLFGGAAADAAVRMVPVWNGVPCVAEYAGWMQRADFKGGAGETAWVPEGAPALLVGLGSEEAFDAARFFRAWAAAGKALASTKWVDEAVIAAAPPCEQYAGLMAEGLLYGAYAFGMFQAEEDAAPLPICCTGFSDTAVAAMQEAVKDAAVLAEMRDAANQPANLRTTWETGEWLAEKARMAGLDARLLDEDALRAEKCGALLSVAKGSPEGACLLRVEWPGAEKAAEPPLVLVGKAILFDSGGICLKPPKGMEWMQYDKCGGMVVLTAAMLAARRKSARRVVAYIPMTKNVPSGTATLPGDIVRARNGKTVEVVNTDAEGRLILADALSLAAEEKPAAIVDVATLTGAVVIALGHEAAAVVSTDDALCAAVETAAAETGERVWRLPLWAEYDEALKGRFATLKNIGDGTAGTISGGAFLKAFVPEGVPWLHMDIAGTAWVEAAAAWAAPGATLAGARLLAAWIGAQ